MDTSNDYRPKYNPVQMTEVFAKAAAGKGKDRYIHYDLRRTDAGTDALFTSGSKDGGVSSEYLIEIVDRLAERLSHGNPGFTIEQLKSIKHSFNQLMHNPGLMERIRRVFDSIFYPDKAEALYQAIGNIDVKLDIQIKGLQDAEKHASSKQASQPKRTEKPQQEKRDYTSTTEELALTEAPTVERTHSSRADSTSFRGTVRELQEKGALVFTSGRSLEEYLKRGNKREGDVCVYPAGEGYDIVIIEDRDGHLKAGDPIQLLLPDEDNEKEWNKALNTLGFEPGATPTLDEIKKNFSASSRKTHTDQGSGSDAEFEAVQLARQTLIGRYEDPPESMFLKGLINRLTADARKFSQGEEQLQAMNSRDTTIYDPSKPLPEQLAAWTKKATPGTLFVQPSEEPGVKSFDMHVKLISGDTIVLKRQSLTAIQEFVKDNENYPRLMNLLVSDENGAKKLLQEYPGFPFAIYKDFVGNVIVDNGGEKFNTFSSNLTEVSSMIGRQMTRIMPPPLEEQIKPYGGKIFADGDKCLAYIDSHPKEVGFYPSDKKNQYMAVVVMKDPTTGMQIVKEFTVELSDDRWRKALGAMGLNADASYTNTELQAHYDKMVAPIYAQISEKMIEFGRAPLDLLLGNIETRSRGSPVSLKSFLKFLEKRALPS